ANLTIVVAPPTSLAIASSSLDGGVQGIPYSEDLQSTGGTDPDTWTVIGGTFPSGLGLDSSAGTISGTPTGSGTFGFTVQETDSSTPSAESSTASLTLFVDP